MSYINVLLPDTGVFLSARGLFLLHSCGWSPRREGFGVVRCSRWRRPVECSCSNSGAWRLYRRAALEPFQAGQDTGRCESDV
ncbi:hypothetical protein R3I93_014495 [Phoxinus phoxinus]|uniref:Uncharacterized protein n=1 Tax=Phoxinus phoxinus TaxID=58324 RepID=A0AAN9CTE6_9TELE